MSVTRSGPQLVLVLAGWLLVAAGAARGETISVGSELYASLSGVVYCDITNDAVRDDREIAITGVEILLKGTLEDGQTVSLSTVTDTSGQYLFDDLAAGTYSLSEVQPKHYVQGKANAVGSAGGEATGSDQFTGIVLTAGLEATNYNFGEYGLKAKYISKEPFLKTVPEPSVLALLAAGGLGLLAGRRRRRSGDR